MSLGPANDVIFIRNAQISEVRTRQYVTALLVSSGAICSGAILMWWISPLAQEVSFEVAKLSYAAFFGGLLSTIPVGFLVDKMGRLTGFLTSTGCFLLSCSLNIATRDESMLILWLSWAGFATGCNLITGPIYLGEIAEHSIRGKLISIFHLFLVIGENSIFFVGYMFSTYDEGVLAALLMIIPVIFFFGFCCTPAACAHFIPESPTFLLKTNAIDDSRRSLRTFRGHDYNVDRELLEVQQLFNDAGVKDNLISTLRALLAAVEVFCLQQLCNYVVLELIIDMPQLLLQSKSYAYSRFAHILLPLVHTLTSFVFVFSVEVVKRKTWLTISSLGMAVCILIFAVYLQCQKLYIVYLSYQVAIASAILFVVFFSIGYGPIPWILLGELFNPEIKGIAAGITCLTMWWMNIVLNWSFPIMVDVMEKHVLYYLIAGIMILTVIFTHYCVPETGSKTLPQIQEDLKKMQYR